MTRNFVPFVFSEAKAETGPRFGGPPPRGVFPTGADSHYLVTVPNLQREDQEVSIYLNCDFDFILDNCGLLLADDSVEVIPHPKSPRDRSREGHYLEYGLRLLAPQVEASEEVFEHHKLGGIPYLIHPYEDDLEIEVAKLVEAGYMQIVQLDFPAGGGDCLVAVSWPFADGIFHLLGKDPFEAGCFRWFWEIG